MTSVSLLNRTAVNGKHMMKTVKAMKSSRPSES